jgi:hypothetical protein
MTIDGCTRTFEELTTRILPAYMAELRTAMRADVPLAEFSVKGDGPVTLQKRYGLSCDPRGCYVLIDHGRPVYVGISKHVIARLLDHVRGGDHFTATLAYRIAAAGHPHAMTAADAMTDSSFRAAFDEARGLLSAMTVAWVAVENPLELYVFEAYAAMELDTGTDSGGWNTFATH